jgi:hypothetical protein
MDSCTWAQIVHIIYVQETGDDLEAFSVDGLLSRSWSTLLFAQALIA